MRLTSVVFAALLSFFTFSNDVFGLPGNLDPTFGNGGKVLISSLNTVDVLRTGMTVQPDGKILYVGHNYTGSIVQLVVLRLNADGTFDTAFGNSGYFNTNFGGILSAGIAAVVQPDNKIVVAGVASNGFGPDANFALVRINPNGTLDTTFDGDGKVTTSFDAGFNDFAHGVVLQPDGKIVAAGFSINGAETHSFFAAARYNSNGSLDSTFDGDGRFVSSAGNRPLSDGYAIALQTDGKIVIGGGVYEEVLAAAEFAVIRLNPNGSFDNSFDGDGKVQIPVFGQVETIHDLKIQNDGKIVAVGYTDVSISGGNDDFAVVRLNPNGSIDSTFSNDGKTTFSFNQLNEIEQAWAVEIQQNGKIVVGGVSGKVDPDQGVPILSADFAMVRFNSDGSPDMSFGTNGAVVTSFQNPLNIGFGMDLQRDGKILLSGATGDNDPETLDSRIGIVRYVGDETTPIATKSLFDFDGDSRTDISIFRPSVGEWWYLRSSDGSHRAFQFGNSTDKIVPADFTGDRKTDIALWRESSGEWFVLRSEDSTYYSFPFGIAGDIATPADYDGDLIDDPAMFRPSNATWYILNSGGGTRIQQFGAAGDQPVRGDYDGDGKFDLAIFRPSDGQWWVNRSSNQLTFVQTFGISSDKPTPADFTGDGKTDIAFFRQSTGEWFVLRSENLSFYSFPFGQNGDIPVVGDYDADGKADPAIFRSSNATWYLQRSASGFTAALFGLSDDKPVPSAYSP